MKEQGRGIKKSVTNIADTLKPDSLKKVNKSLVRKKIAASVSKPVLSDSAGFKFENGKLQKEHGEFKAPELKSIKIPDKVVNPLENRSVELPESGIESPDSLKAMPVQRVREQKDEVESVNERALKVQSKSDSLNAIIKDPRQFKSLLLNNKIPEIKDVYSSKKLKKIYDSLGYGKMDSILAMVPKKDMVSEEALIQKLNLPFESQAPDLPSDLGDLAKTDEISQLKEGIGDYDLSKLKLPDSVLRELPPMRGTQIGSKILPKLDSLREALLNKERLKLKEQELTDEVTEAVVKKKPSFMDKIYFEGVMSILKNPDSPEIQVAPSLGFKVTKDFSVGIGPNILIRAKDKELTVLGGYRSFAKYEVMNQRGFLQLEDIVDPYQVSRESFTYASHSILAGGGYLLPVSKVLSVNFSLLYRVNNQAYSGGRASPWVFRLGISITRNRKPKSLKK